MKHLKRLANGMIFFAILGSIISLVIALVILFFDGLDKFAVWKYRNDALGIMVELGVIYLVGLFLEMV